MPDNENTEEMAPDKQYFIHTVTQEIIPIKAEEMIQEDCQIVQFKRFGKIVAIVNTGHVVVCREAALE